jgi:hypothetical protein
MGMKKISPEIKNHVNFTVPDQTYERVVHLLIKMVLDRQDKATKYLPKSSRGGKENV